MTPEIYISYAWRDREKDPTPDDRESVVDRFCEAATAKGFLVHRDKTDIGYRQNIEKFMLAIGSGKYVVPMISHKYLRSEYCMFEAVRVLAHERFEERVFPVVLPDADIFSPNALNYKGFWKTESENLTQLIDKNGRDSGIKEFLSRERIYKEIHENMAQFITRIAKLNVLSAKIHLENGFEVIFEALDKQIDLDRAEGTRSRLDPMPDTTPNITFPKFVIKDFKYEHVLRPAQMKSVLAELPASLNIVAEKGQGLRRFMEDLVGSGIKRYGIRLIQVRLPLHLRDYDAFLHDIAEQGGLLARNAQTGMGDIFRAIARQHQRPIFFLLEDLDEILADRPDMDQRFDLDFLSKLNGLKNVGFVNVLATSRQPISHARFRGVSSPLVLKDIHLNPLSHDNLCDEVRRRLPELTDDMRFFIAEQLEYDPTHTYELLAQLLQRLDGRAHPSREFIGQELKGLRQKLANNGRK